MTNAPIKFSSLHLISVTVSTIVFCAAAASAIVGWTPGMSGLPADVTAISDSN